MNAMSRYQLFVCKKDGKSITADQLIRDYMDLWDEAQSEDEDAFFESFTSTMKERLNLVTSWDVNDAVSSPVTRSITDDDIKAFEKTMRYVYGA